MQTSNKKNVKFSMQTLLIALCAVLALALIVVSAFAYTWHRDMNALKKRAMTLQAEASSIDALSTEIQNLTIERATLQAQLESVTNELNQLKSAAEGE